MPNANASPAISTLPTTSSFRAEDFQQKNTEFYCSNLRHRGPPVVDRWSCLTLIETTCRSYLKTKSGDSILTSAGDLKPVTLVGWDGNLYALETCEHTKFIPFIQCAKTVKHSEVMYHMYLAKLYEMSHHANLDNTFIMKSNISLCMSTSYIAFSLQRAPQWCQAAAQGFVFDAWVARGNSVMINSAQNDVEFRISTLEGWTSISSY